MSDDSNPMPWAEAAEKAAAFVKYIEDLTPTYLAGSLRRNKAMVNDIEIVTCAPSRAALLARLDRLVSDGICEKALYQNGTHRWDTKYAGLTFQGARVEVFSPEPDNLGYILWLRTGPGDANKFIMENSGDWPIRFDDGFAWFAEYERGVKYLRYRLRVPDEKTLFALLGMGIVEPERRTVQTYKRLFKRSKPPLWFIEKLRIADAKQGSLF